MNKTTLKNLVLSAAVTVLVVSCSTSGNPATGDITKAAGDAAVDAATKNANPLTGAAIRNTTGYGTDPVEAASTGLLNSIGL